MDAHSSRPLRMLPLRLLLLSLLIATSTVLHVLPLLLVPAGISTVSVLV